MRIFGDNPAINDRKAVWYVDIATPIAMETLALAIFAYFSYLADPPEAVPKFEIRRVYADDTPRSIYAVVS